MAAKVERARRQARALAAQEYSKPHYGTGNGGNLALANVRRAELSEMVSQFNGEITRGPTGEHPTPIGKQRRYLATDPKATGRKDTSVRLTVTAHDYYAMWSAEPFPDGGLIRR